MPGLALTGIEIDPDLAALAGDNAAANGMAGAILPAADIFALPPELKRDFDQVFCNPPFHGEGAGLAERGPRHRPDGRGPD